MTWISVKDQKPPHHEWVLLMRYFSHSKGGLPVYNIGEYDEDKETFGFFCEHSDLYNKMGVYESHTIAEFDPNSSTYWMKLPKAPDPNMHFSGCEIIARIRNNCWSCKGMFDMGICDRGDDCDRKVKLKAKYRCVEGCEYKDEVD